MNRFIRTAAFLCLGLAAVIVQPSHAQAANNGKALRIVYISHDPLTDPWMIPVAKGLKQAAKDLGINLVFRSVQNLTGPANNELRLIQDALESKPDGLIIADWNPVGLNAGIKDVVDKGIPVVIATAGFGEQKATGALAYVGNDEYQMGFVGGQLLYKAGSRRAMIMTSLPGLKVADERAAGFAKGFAPGKVISLKVPFDVLVNTTGLVNAAMATLQKDPSIDGVFSIGACCSAAFVAIIDQLGARARKMHFGTIDLGTPVLKAIADGRVDFALDEQQYLQGYMSVLTLVDKVRFDFSPAESFIPTGPVVVDKRNIDRILTLTSEKVR